MFLADKLQQVVDDLSMIDDAHERLALLVDRAKKTSPLGPAERAEENRVRGCVSVVWLAAEARAGCGFFRADAESPLVRGLVVFVAEFFSGAPLEEIATTTLDPLGTLGLAENLSPTRRNGLTATRATIQAFARRAISAPGPGA